MRDWEGRKLNRVVGPSDRENCCRFARRDRYAGKVKRPERKTIRCGLLGDQEQAKYEQANGRVEMES